MEGLNGVRIGVVGAAECSQDVYKAAHTVGQEIGKRRAVLICGGLGGVMEAAAKGAIEAGGMTVGILPGDNENQANAYITIPIPTGLSHARNVLIARISQVLIAISGGYGTLSEIALALKMEKGVIGLHTWRHIPGIVHAADSIEAVDLAFQMLPKWSETGPQHPSSS
jgi:uncharacterized protein (TIGR00725 family)